MEYLKGGELMASIIQRSYFKESDARRVMQQLVHALSYMHKKKVVHRDIKPANLILIHRGLESPVKIVDFGFATIESSDVLTTEPSQQQSTILCGTPGFLAPEVILSRSYTCKVDIWCLGKIVTCTTVVLLLSVVFSLSWVAMATFGEYYCYCTSS